MRWCFFAISLLFICCTPKWVSSTTSRRPYVSYFFNGHNIIFCRSILHQPIGKLAKKIIEYQIKQIDVVLPLPALRILRKVPIWFRKSGRASSTKDSIALYHPNKCLPGSLHKQNTRCFGYIEFPNASAFVRSAWFRANSILLHELAHAYHNLILGYQHPAIHRVYKAALRSKKYDRVWNQVSRRFQRSYALFDHKEFFAKFSQTLFAVNDTFPHQRSELIRHAPGIYKMMLKAWRIGPKFAFRRYRVKNGLKQYGMSPNTLTISIRSVHFRKALAFPWRLRCFMPGGPALLRLEGPKREPSFKQRGLTRTHSKSEMARSKKSSKPFLFQSTVVDGLSRIHVSVKCSLWKRKQSRWKHLGSAKRRYAITHLVPQKAHRFHLYMGDLLVYGDFVWKRRLW